MASEIDESPHAVVAPFDGLAGERVAVGRQWSPRQRELLDALGALYLAQGFRHLTIGDLVDQLSCSRRTLYSLAPSKEELVLVVIERFFNRMGVRARAEAASHADPGVAIAAYLATGVTAFMAAQTAFTEDLESYLPTKQLYDRHLDIALRVLGQLVDDGIHAERFRAFHSPLIAEILDACVARIRKPDVLARAGVSSSQAIAEFSDLIRYGLAQEDLRLNALRASAPATGTAPLTNR